MSIPLPSLDDRRYDDLLEEARALIPSLAPQWTNHNPSDPGITLIELFAWLTEMLIYRVNRLPEANIHAFLRLLNGPQWEPGPDLDEDIRNTVLDLRKRHRAVTAEDYEALAKALPGVARARCVPRRNLAAETEEERNLPQEGCISLVVVPKPDLENPGLPIPSQALLDAVRDDLAPRRLLTVRQLIVPPVYVPIQAEIVVATRPEVQAGPLRTKVKQAIERYLDALTGGPDGEGWPFGRDVYVSELYGLLEKEVGVDYVPDITLSSPKDAPDHVAGGELWNEKGDQIGIELKAHHLPWAKIDLNRIVVGSEFLRVRIEIEVTAKKGFEETAQRAVKTTVKRLFHPLHDGPEGSGPWEVTKDEIASKVKSLPDIQEVSQVILGDRARTGLRFEAGEIADVTVKVKIL